MTLYVIRHGETDADLNPAVGGRFVAQLNNTGIEQAKKAAEKLKNTDLSVIYTSPLVQAVKTADIINEYHNVYIQKQFVLNEMETGTMHGHSKSNSEYEMYHTSIFKRFPEGESNADLITRVYPFVELLRKQTIYDADVLIVTHNNICRIIDTYFSNNADQTFITDEWKNCEIRTYEIEQKQTNSVVAE